MTPAIEAKRPAFNTYRQTSTERNLHILRSARNKVQQTARRSANEYWTELSDDIQTASGSGNIRGMYEGINKATGVKKK